MTYPPPGGYQPDPYGQQYPQGPAGPQQQPPAGYGQPADPYGQAPDQYGAPTGPYGQPADPYGQPPPWPGQAPQSPGYEQNPGYGPPPPPPPPDSFLQGGAPQPPKKSPVGWIVGGVVAVVLIVGIVGAMIIFFPFGDSDSDTDADSSNGSSSSESATDDESEVAVDGTPTETVDQYYNALYAHDMDAAMETLCTDMAEASKDDPFAPHTEDEFWEIVDSSIYLVGEETMLDEQNAEVTVDHSWYTEDDYGEEVLTAELVVEDNAWKICYWQEPQPVS